MVRSSRLAHHRLIRLSCSLALLTGLVLVAGASSAEDPAAVSSAPPQQGKFEAQWTVSGTQERLSFADVGEQAIFKHKGQLTVLRSDGLVGNALSSCIGLSDSRSGSNARCVWIADEGAQIFSDVSRLPAAAGESGRGVGRIVGGTGRFAGIEGSYELRWIESPQALSEDVAGKTLSMSGRWQIREPVAKRARP